MRREDAIKKLTKLLGKNFGYRVDPKAPDADDRAEAKANLAIQRPIRDELEKRKKARVEELLEGDEEYQRLKAAYKTAAENCEKLGMVFHHYRFTVGKTTGPFFSVMAQGDSWEEVIAKLQKEKAG